MKNIKRYKELFESQTELTPEQMEWLDKFTRGTWTLNPQTGLVDVDGGFYCNSQNLTDFKGVRFGVVAGSFWCYNNKLTSLKDAPQKVGGSFNCFSNPVSESVLKSLYKKMQSGMSWPDAVASQWKNIRSVEDRILLAPYNNSLSPDEKAYYQAIGALKRRSI